MKNLPSQHPGEIHRSHSKFDFRSLKSRIGIGDVLSLHGLDKGLVRKGTRLTGPCPLHGGDNPTAFRVDLARGLWHCFTGCGGGDTVELVRRVLDCSYAAAARHLVHLVGAAERTVQSFEWVHPPPPGGVPFKPFQWAIPLNPQVPFLQQSKGVSKVTALWFEAGVTHKSIFLEGSVAVRLHDLHGNPLGYCGRRLDHQDIIRWGKWRFPRNFPKNETLFNAHRASLFRHRGLVVVECPWAAMRLTQAGIPNVVSLLGTTFSRLQLGWLAHAPMVLIMLDGDHAGWIAAHELASALDGSTGVKVHELPAGMEPEDLTDQELAEVSRRHLPFF